MDNSGGLFLFPVNAVVSFTFNKNAGSSVFVVLGGEGRGGEISYIALLFLVTVSWMMAVNTTGQEWKVKGKREASKEVCMLSPRHYSPWPSCLTTVRSLHIANLHTT